MTKKFLSIILLFGGAITAMSEVRYTIRKLVPDEDRIFSSGGAGINRYGTVAGGFWTTNDPPESRLFVYSDAGGFQDLGTLGAGLAFAEDINDAGQISLRGNPVSGVSYVYRYTPGIGFENLGGLEDSEYSEVGGINNLGQITGGTDFPYTTRAFRYTDGVGLKDLGALFGIGSRGRDINDLGWVTGWSDGHIFVFTDTDGMAESRSRTRICHQQQRGCRRNRRKWASWRSVLLFRGPNADAWNPGRIKQ